MRRKAAGHLRAVSENQGHKIGCRSAVGRVGQQSTLSCRSRFSEPARRPGLSSTRSASMKQPFVTTWARPVAVAGHGRLFGISLNAGSSGTMANPEDSTRVLERGRQSKKRALAQVGSGA
jgi:hypothetical protein